MGSKYTLTNPILGVAPALFTNLNHLVGMAIYGVDEIEDLHLSVPTSAFHRFFFCSRFSPFSQTRSLSYLQLVACGLQLFSILKS